MQRTHSEIVRLWPSLIVLAADLNESRETVRLWEKRNRIPTWHWPQIVAAARKRRLGVTTEELALGMLIVNGR